MNIKEYIRREVKREIDRLTERVGDSAYNDTVVLLRRLANTISSMPDAVFTAQSGQVVSRITSIVQSIKIAGDQSRHAVAILSEIAGDIKSYRHPQVGIVDKLNKAAQLLANDSVAVG